MTALKDYARLECAGVWQPTPDAQRTNVTVTFGEASLIVADSAGQALSHWSLAAVERINPGKSPALFAPSAEASEILEISEPTMVDAIEKVRTAIVKARPRSGRLRMAMLLCLVTALAGGVALWLPEALIRHTAKVVPDPTRASIGSAMFEELSRVSGAPCRTDLGDAALAQLHTRLVAPARGGFLVLPGGIDGTTALPGGLILLNRTLVEDYDNPDVLAGYVLAETLRRKAIDPLERLLRHSGFRPTLRLLTTGDMDKTALRSYAETLAREPAPAVPNDAMLAAFAKAKVAATPYAYGVDVTGESTLPLIEADPMRSGGAEPILADSAWIALQQICGG
ncbi:MAG: hypothetical protein AAFQ66_22310 [Pseudomonadota bacterium]